MMFTAVVVSHANEEGLRRTLDMLAGQTQPPDETVAMCSDTPQLGILEEEYPTVRFHRCPNLDDWGHAKRAEGLRRASSVWVGFFNDDDAYASDYLEKMLGHAGDGVDAVFCSWNECPHGGFKLYEATAGNFIVRAEAGRRVGYPASRIYENDGHFINALVADGARAVKVDELLYHHNAYDAVADRGSAG